MKIAVINEISAAAKNPDVIEALQGRGFEVLNLGNTKAEDTPALQYIHTGLMASLLLHLKVVDFVIGGCGTGVGFLNSVLQYPGVSCGLVLSPLDAWLFARINAGNCVSLALNQGYGWASNINLKMIFDELFTTETASGYPPHRAEPQRISRGLLNQVSLGTHKSFSDILRDLPLEVTKPALDYPTFKPVILDAVHNDVELEEIIKKILS